MMYDRKQKILLVEDEAVARNFLDNPVINAVIVNVRVISPPGTPGGD